MKTVQDAIAEAIKIGKPKTKERLAALKSVRWYLRTSYGYVCVQDGEPTIFDGRDNEEMKCRYYSAILGVPVTAELVIE